MKYETVDKMREVYYFQFWVSVNSSYSNPKDKYTLGDLLRFLPVYVFSEISGNIRKGIRWVWNHRKQWVIAKAPSNSDKDSRSEQ